jgi:8-oxo-dGTP pyrophosphatase MutT (NUDIX family)
MAKQGPSILERLSTQGQDPAKLGRPERCRAIIFNRVGTHVLLIGRQRPNQPPYVVFPGGGLEKSDATPMAGVLRELDEELGLRPSDVVFSGRVLRHEGNFFYLAYAPKDLRTFTMTGPEAHKDPAVYGTYSPGWFALSSLHRHNVRPQEMAARIC